jgi:iron complex outermembrane receptor protein
VRTPSRVEQDLRLEGATGPTTPVFVEVNGDRKFQSEELVAFEGGYRVQPIETLSLDIAGFHNRYADLLSVESGGPPTTAPIGGGATGTFLPLVFRNDLAGRAYGVEVAADWSILEWWQLHGAYSWLDIQLETVKGGTDHATEYSEERSSPHHTFAVRSYMDLPRNTELDLTFRFVDSLPAQRVGSYGTLDAHIGWRPTPIIELALFGENLVEDHHAEFPYGGSAGTIGVRRSGYAAVTVRW